ncbi:hypothetical protein [Inquilinus sp. Marseille-Q2685]|uniref:hypothetical protein n=1 Tax=Inquilinus sp. Marseille-Q2685 TaxID=2866581 RepID=UPI001CE484F5|nr:hypothetical protein [Inquilinus sp. Marseille-Q2685]
MRAPTIAAAAALLLALGTAGPAAAQAGLTTRATTLEPLKLSSGVPFPEKPYELEAGKYYRWTIEADGTAELAIAAPEFFRNIWINEVVINKIEVRPLGLDSIEFDDEGKATISFVPIRPGTFTFHAPGTEAEGMRGTFVVK